MIIHKCDQGSYEWHQLRLGKITGSRLKKMMAKDNLTLIDELIAEEECGLPDDDNFMTEEMQRGLDLEPLAIQEYCNITGYDVDYPCLLQSSDWPILCQSPDGCIKGAFEGSFEGAIEVKCPKTKNHIKYIRMGKIPNEYKEQVWSYFLVNTSLEWLDFVSYDPRLIKKPIWVLRINRSDIQQDLDMAASELEKFIAKLEKYKSEIFF